LCVIALHTYCNTIEHTQIGPESAYVHLNHG